MRNRNFSLLWVALIVSTLGDIFYDVGVMVVVFERTGSALQTVGVTIAAKLPAFLVGPFAGALVDRYPRKWVMVTMDMIRVLLVGLLLILVQHEAFSLLGIYTIVATLAVATTFYTPARLAIIPSLVAKHELVQANSLIMGTKQAAMAIGYAGGGVLALTIGFRGLVTLDMVSFGLAALAVSFISYHQRSLQERNQQHQTSIRRDIIEGLAYLRSHRLARALISMEVMEFFPHAIWTPALMLVFAREALGANTDGWGYQNAAFFGGMLLGSVLSIAWSAKIGLYAGKIIIFNAFLSSVLTIIYAGAPTLLPAIILAGLFGPVMAMRDVAQDSLLQANVSPNVMGRVYATREMFINLTFLLGGICFAWLADQISVRAIYVIGGLLYSGTALYALSSWAIRHGAIIPQPAQLRSVAVAVRHED